MMRKAQISQIIIIFSAVVVFGIVIWGLDIVKKTSESMEDARLLDFTESIENMAVSFHINSGMGSVREFSFSLPSSAKEVCFVDKSKGFNELASPELNKEIRVYSEDNVFVFSEDDSKSYRISYIYLEKSPLCLLTDRGKIDLKFNSAGNRTIIEGVSAEKEPECTSVRYSGDSDSKIDIVFLGTGYGIEEDFADDVERYVFEHILTFSPFDDEKDKFNFFRLDEQADLGCKITDLIRCDDYKVKIHAAKCPNDYIIILASRSRMQNTVSHVRSSAIGNLAKINTADNPNVLMHEFGHAFGGLADEYVDENYYGRIDFKADEYPNCDNEGCAKWEGVDDTRCIRGCSLNSYFRPTTSSIMRSLQSAEFGPVNEVEIGEKLGAYQ